MQFAATWLNVESSVLREVSQREGDKHRMNLSQMHDTKKHSGE